MPFMMSGTAYGMGGTVKEWIGNATLGNFPQPQKRLPIPRNGTLSGFKAYVISNTGTGPLVVSVAVNGVAVLSVNVPIGGTGVFSSANTVAVAEGAFVSFIVDGSASPAGLLNINAVCLFS